MQFYDLVSVNRANSRLAYCELIYMTFPLRISISQSYEIIKTAGTSYSSKIIYL